jgi:uncharacterized repeat protein (TIGR03803 family)
MFVMNVCAQNPAFTILRTLSFSDGATPSATLTLAGDTLYGTTFAGGSNSSGFTPSGTVFRMNADGTGHTVLRSFDSSTANSPRSSLTLSGTMLYGTLQSGNSGNGGLFKIDTNGSNYAVLKNFAGTDGASPYGGLAVSGNILYGTTYGGGSQGAGTLFRINNDGSAFSTLRSFGGTITDSQNPVGTLVLSGSTLYGVTYSGGTSISKGTVYKVSTSGSGFVILKSFTGTDGANPYAGLLLAGDTLYGTTYNGGAQNYGTVFRVNTDGSSFSTLFQFSLTNGWNPYAGLTLVGTNLFGTTYNGGSAYNYGVIFRISTNGTGFSVLKHLLGTDNCGTHPYGGLAAGAQSLYGTAAYGGSKGNGTLFSLSLNQAATAPGITMQPASRTNQAGSGIRFEVTATGDQPLSYQWRKNDANLTDGGVISGAKSNIFTMANAQPAYAGNYTVVITNSSGSITSNIATLSINRPPNAGVLALQLPRGLPYSFPASTLLTRASDPDGDPITIVAVQSPSSMGISTTFTSGMVTYNTPFAGTTDRFMFTVADNRGGTNYGAVDITLTGTLPGPDQITLQSLPGGWVEVIGAATGFRYSLDATRSLGESANWQALQTNVMRDGFVAFTNLPSAGTNTFYRLRRIPTLP